ncbi:phage tail protein I [Microbulbifer taiwanensis]|uniref:Phage tail protein I n=1 Tax=Microbulbifer taiwanensis TaxID=986746 RepID=A0ABW1YGA3_9GAMM|nr:phage tail protein I [Microbulbifer taiwanensis]
MTDHRNEIEAVSSYLSFLPAPLQDGHFIGQFLRAFEAILSGGVVTAFGEMGGAADQPEWQQGLGETLDRITHYFQPQETPADFLPWLARWVAVDLRRDWSEQTRRNLVASIVPLYMLRGTRRGIAEVVRLCVGETADVRVDDRVVDPRTGKPYAYYFRVTLVVDTRQTPTSLQQLYRKVEAAIELQKPAHTYYSLVLRYPSLVLLDEDPDTRPKTRATEGIYVGRNTTLGNAEMGPDGEKLPLQQISSTHRNGKPK